MSMKPRAAMLAMVALSACAATAQTTLQWSDSLNTLRREIARSPYSTDLHLRKAAVNMELGQWDYATEEYDLVLEKEPNNPAALFFRAFAHNKMRRYGLAEADYRALLRITPYNLEARIGLSNTLIMRDKQAEALDEMNRMVEMFPDSAVAYASRASLERDMGALAASLDDWEEAVRRSPSDADLLLSLADVQLRMGRKSDAKATLDRIVELGTPRGVLREWYEKARQ